MEEFLNNYRLAQRLNDDLKSHGATSSAHVVSKVDYDDIVKDNELRGKTEKLFRDGHYTETVEAAIKFLENLVKQRVGLIDDNISGVSLMNKVFSANAPLLLINNNQSISEKDEQNGYRSILSGCMQGIRNPRVHEVDWKDSRFDAIRLLAFIDYLVERIKNANVVDKK